MATLSHWLYRFAHPRAALVVPGRLRRRLEGCPRSDRSGIPTFVAAGEVDATDLIQRVEGAIELIAALDAERVAALRTDVQQIVIERRPTRYSALTHTCYLDAAEVTRQSPGSLALALVHEGTHARLERSGQLPWPWRIRAHERACLEAELDFLERLRGAGWTRLEDTERWLRSALENPVSHYAGAAVRLSETRDAV